MARKVVSRYAVFENLGGARDIVFYYEAGGADSVTGVSAAEADYIVDLLRHEKPMSYDHALKRLSNWTSEPVGEAEESPDLDAWLNAHPGVAAAIVWEDANGSHPWSSWSAAWKSQLRGAFALAWVRASIPVPEVPANQAALADGDSATTVLAAADAWAYFKASIALSVAVEIGQWVPWSVTGYTAEQLAQLFDSREMFKWQGSPAGYRIESRHGHVVPAPPERSSQFLGANDLLDGTRLGTLGRVLDWCRTNLVHFTGGLTAANVEDQWQYRGFPPMTRIFDGTVQTSQPQFGTRHRTAGCWGTTGFLRALLRTVNVPVRLVTNAGHAQPHFMADGRYLSHGDDPYNQLTKCVPPYSATELLINQSKFDAWFGGGVSNDDKDDNIGRRPRELAIVHLPNYILHKHCGDVAANRSHADSDVFEVFERNYTVAQFEAEQLWERMDAKIASFGGCANVP
jgi:hypothetical protein